MNMDERLMVAQAEIDRKINTYKGKKVSELKKSLFISLEDNKASFVKLARKMLAITNNKIDLRDEGFDAVLKTVRLTGMEKPAEAMSFMPVNFQEWTDTKTWEESSLYKYFSRKVLVLFVFQQYTLGNRVDDNEITFLDAKVWKMPEYDLNHGLKEVWDETRYLVKEQRLVIKPIQRKNGSIINTNNLPSSNFNTLGHLRPGAKNGDDKVILPTGQSIVKQKFWFNIEYVKEILES
ncbi:DNA mismatch repair protein MutH [Listeria booriae]|uniref:DNA mismatch repair protein MutH n=1 Tax=Listeria booriae TaxID=1552123 RepID=UPI0016242D7F|nr:DNA mismatch repair protein MutH [Listeria booriae]MBC2205630.1 DNA mismatch repair protein MutH [Listeria booriae]